MLTKKDYCDYETCVALKELGYRKPTLAFYPQENFTVDCIDDCGDLYECEFERGTLVYYSSLNNKHIKVIKVDAPLLYEAQKFLREEKKIHIEVYATAGGYIWELCKAYETTTFSGGTTIYTPNDVDNPRLNDAGRYDSYEEALWEGVRASIKLLKEEKR